MSTSLEFSSPVPYNELDGEVYRETYCCGSGRVQYILPTTLVQEE